ncbi:Hypothetical protein DEACI_0298 [Acididesulfobacillus acetoxydans]|uniref:Uncharacterized protein n=1 Tax=Acididesulfobacillus acetoxydans TaxID=1561005 RepID=A0A8S0WDY0_9FIRM|nr:Hypothetical protein DEACI_0298 [Acididesulfobacillus acetoxydans]CEJ06224.1 Hypothetical protein DEACI_0671 [Acididesulfobacillus acetoxydans]
MLLKSLFMTAMVAIRISKYLLGASMVEARGLAPLYRRATTKASTRVAFVFKVSPLMTPKGGIRSRLAR